MARFKHVAIERLAIVEAPHRITSEAIERELMPAADRLGLTPGTLEMLTGVVARRFWDEGTLPSTVATQAALRVLEESHIDRERIGVLINTSVCKDYLEPSVASTVHGHLGLSTRCLNFDVGNACLAFLNGMEIVSTMIEHGQIDFGLVVDGEGSRHIIETTVARLLKPDSNNQDLRNDFATLTLGSGAAAMLLCRDDYASTEHRFHGGVLQAATQWNQLCCGTAERMITDAGQLLRSGVALAKETFELAKDQLHWRRDNLDELIMHQVGSIHMATFLKTLKMDPVLAHITYTEYGNMGPAAIPFTLKKSIEAGRIDRGDRIALMGIGSGLNCAMMEVEW